MTYTQRRQLPLSLPFSCAALVMLLAPTFSSCRLFLPNKHNSAALPSTVGVPNTKVENQGMSGFCWSYSVNALVESWALSRKNLQVNLSEEYSGFYRLAQELFEFTKSSSAADLASGCMICNIKEGARMQKSIDLVRDFGVIPESVWSGKRVWQSARSIEAVKNKLIENLKTLAIKKNGEAITFDEIVNQVMVGEGAFPPLPKFPFFYGNSYWTPQTFASQMLGFNASDFAELLLTKPEDYPSLVSAIKRSLVRGIPVPFGFHALQGTSARIIPYEADHIQPKVENFSSDGGHIALVTDFVNVGGDTWAMSKEQISDHVARSADQLRYLSVKNSWGVDSGSAEPGVNRGYNIVDQGYLRGTLAYGYASLLVLKDIQKDPLNAPVQISPIVIAGSKDREVSLFKVEIEEALKLGFMHPLADGSFRPNALVKRELSIDVLMRALKSIPGMKISTPRSLEMPFLDVPSETPWAGSLQWLKDRKVFLAQESGYFEGDKPMSRAELMSVLATMARIVWLQKSPQSAFPIAPKIGTHFLDTQGHQSENDIDTMAEFCGAAPAYKLEEQYFAPNAKVTRDVLAASLVRWKKCISNF